MMGSSIHAGIDVSARSLAVRLEGQDTLLEFSNDAKGHRALVRRLTQRGRSARACLEASGIYGLDLAIALHGHPRIEVMVVNPRVLQRFAEAYLQRSKTDALDATSILEFVRRMDFVPWRPPEPEILALRSISRRIEGLVRMQTQEKNRLHASSRSQALPQVVRDDVRDSIEQLDQRIAQLRSHALQLLRAHPKLDAAFGHLVSIKGVATASAITLLGELGVLAPDMTRRQWVAHAGLDPREQQSGTSLHKPARITRRGNAHVRQALFLPALVAAQHEPQVVAFYQHLLGRGKTKMQANVAVMRKLLHAIHGMLRNDQDFIGDKFFATKA
jgi:transposase